jgi:hypothetical protein
VVQFAEWVCESVGRGGSVGGGVDCAAEWERADGICDCRRSGAGGGFLLGRTGEAGGAFAVGEFAVGVQCA